MNVKVRPVPPQVMNGYSEEYQYTELEFLGPATEFECQEELREEGWTAREDGEFLLFFIECVCYRA